MYNYIVIDIVFSCMYVATNLWLVLIIPSLFY